MSARTHSHLDCRTPLLDAAAEVSSRPIPTIAMPPGARDTAFLNRDPKEEEEGFTFREEGFTFRVHLFTFQEDSPEKDKHLPAEGKDSAIFGKHLNEAAPFGRPKFVS